SNALEAIHYLSTLRSFRGAARDDLIAHGAHEAMLSARVEGGPLPQDVVVVLRRDHDPSAPRLARSTDRGRSVTVDGKRPRSFAAYHGSVFHTVLFAPADVSLGSGTPATRRAYLDAILERLDPAFEPTLREYERALRGRNRLLRADVVDGKQLVAFDRVLAPLGARIVALRTRLVQRLVPEACKAFARIVGGAPVLEPTYRPRVSGGAEALVRALAAAHDKDRARGFTADGPHADDLDLCLDGRLARSVASQGQLRAIALALRAAELEVLRQVTGRVPILLLDDVSSELDPQRNAWLFEHLTGLGGQVFLTTTHPDFIRLDAERIDYTVESGRVAREKS
ncbi:MAG: DNA replication and repair protein RecF, partial [Deltaproteobacteria bacterium]|nr:DNA replication and repair protein RecF [Deltaproteobacteria bacterium]